MPFRFPLQALLRLRQTRERQVRLQLELITRELLQVRMELEAFNQERMTAWKEFEWNLRAGMTGADLHLETFFAAVRATRHNALTHELAHLEERRQRQMAAFQTAERQRKVVESLRNRQHEIYRQVQTRRLQRQMDDLFLMRRATSSS